MGKTSQSGQGNRGGWPSTTGNPSGGGRSNAPSRGGSSSSRGNSSGGNSKGSRK